jgi:hypothetical protein
VLHYPDFTPLAISLACSGCVALVGNAVCGNKRLEFGDNVLEESDPMK